MPDKTPLRLARLILVMALVGLLSGTARAAAPTISGFSPTRGPAGAKVVIIGTGLGGTTEVDFGSKSARFTIDSATQISATVPSGATTGRIRVVTPAGSAVSLGAFTVQPNIILILTDDQRYDEVARMPILQSQLAGKGVTFNRGFVVNPLCCPSRTTILTGKYSHGTGIYKNKPPDGGFETFTGRHEDRSTIATWLDAAGYQTSLVGKYLNGYGPTNAAYIPPGWDTWDAMTLSSTNPVFFSEGYYDYPMSINGTLVNYGTAPSDYSTDVLSNYATSFIRSVPRSKPLFLYFAPRAPHGPATPAPKYIGACKSIRPNRPPSYNEANVSDKPPWVSGIPSWDSATIQTWDRFYEKQCESLLSVDDAVGKITTALANAGRLSDTLIVFASDNGVLIGEHRWSRKSVPYEESIRVPFIVRYDPLTTRTASVDHHLVLNLDLAQTFADVAGVGHPGVEGRSFLPLLKGSATVWRKDFLIEHAVSAPPSYCAVRNERFLYAKYEGGFQELYDLQNDPYELANLMVTKPSDPGVRATRDHLYGRMLTLCQPPPPSFTP